MMINIGELQNYYKKYQKEVDPIVNFTAFIAWLKDAQPRKGGVVRSEDRIAAQKKRETEKIQEENEEITPENDINNLKH